MCGALMALAGEGAYKQEEKLNICVIKRKSLYFGLFFVVFHLFYPVFGLYL